MSSTFNQATTPFLTLEQTQLNSDMLIPITIEGTNQLSRLYSFTLECAVQKDATASLLEQEAQILNQPICIKLSASEKSQRYFHGMLTAIHLQADKHRCTFTIEPALAKAKHTLRNRVFNHQSILDVILTVIKEQTTYANTHFKLNIPDAIINNEFYKHKRPLIMQYQESDYDFIARLLSQLGLFFYFEHQQNQHIMHVNDDQTKSPLHNQIIQRDPHTQRAHQSVYNWQATQQVSANNVVVDDYDPNHVDTRLQAGTLDKTKINYQVFPGGFTQQDEAKQLADNLANAFQTQSHYYTADTGNLDVYAGLCVQIENKQNTAEQYLIISQSFCAMGHVPHSHDATTDNQNSFRSTIQLVPLEQTYKPFCNHQKPKVYGLQTATVITPVADNNPQGDSIYTNEDAKVKIRFMWENPQHTADNAAWVRVMQPSAGKQWGTLFTPRQHDEVMVSFQNGDIDLPIIIGSAYNNAHTPAYDLKKSPYTTGFKMASLSRNDTDPSRSNELIFNNEKDKENITLKAQRDYIQVIENNATSVVTGQSTTAVQNGDMMIDVEKGSLLAQAANKVTLEVGASKIVIDASGVNIIAPTIQLNPPGSASTTPGDQQSDKEKTTQSVDHDTSQAN
jgi:type VI secretion system secreted protein VgrG